mgnify:CR=1 FL=1
MTWNKKLAEWCGSPIRIMFQFLQSIIHTPAFYFITGILLIVLFFWYLAAEEDKVKRNAGTFFIIGLCSFSLLSLFLNGMHYGIDIRGGVELTLEVQPKLNDHGEMQQPTQEDMQQACDILNERLNATGTSEVQILHSGNKILIQIPQQDSDPEKNKEKLDAMVKTLTNNRNRTAADLRHIFDKNGGNLGVDGSVSFLFNEKGTILISKEDYEDEDQVMGDALDCGASDFDSDDEFYIISTSTADYYDVRDALEAKNYVIADSTLGPVAMTTAEVTDPDAIAQLEKMLDMMDENEDIQEVFHNWNG